MKHRNLWAWVFIFVFFCTTIGTSRAVFAETVKIGGTGFALGVMGKLAASFEEQYPETKVKIFPSLGSSGGIKALLQGALDIGLSARALKPAEAVKGALAREIVRTPFVFLANSSVKTDGITSQMLERIYSGHLMHWSGGTRIRVILRPKGEQDMHIIRKLSPALDRAITASFAREGMNRAITDQENASLIEKTPGALGGGTLSQVLSENRQVKILSLNGIRPGVEGLADGSYPWFKSLYLVTKADISPAARNFQRFIDSKAGGTILKKYGNMILTFPKDDRP